MYFGTGCGYPVPATNHYCIVYLTRMWANAQRDGRPAKYKWRPVFNAAKFRWRSVPECRAV